METRKPASYGPRTPRCAATPAPEGGMTVSVVMSWIAQAPELEEQVTRIDLDSAILTEQFNFFTVVIMWLIHVGFMAYEAGASRRKNIMSTAMKNILTIAVVTP